MTSSPSIARVSCRVVASQLSRRLERERDSEMEGQGLVWLDVLSVSCHCSRQIVLLVVLVVITIINNNNNITLYYYYYYYYYYYCYYYYYYYYY